MESLSADSIMFEGEIWHTYGNLEHRSFGNDLDHAKYNQYQTAFHGNLKQFISKDLMNLTNIKAKMKDGVAYLDIRKILVQ